VTRLILLGGLYHARRSFTAPTSVTSGTLDIAEIGENLEILLHIRAKLPLDLHVKMTPLEAFNKLKRLALEALRRTSAFGSKDKIHMLETMLPPGYSNFLDRWVTRGVNYIVRNLSAEREANRPVFDMADMFDQVQFTEDPESMLASSMDHLERVGLEQNGQHERMVLPSERSGELTGQGHMDYETGVQGQREPDEEL
jgi:hypothetical protein